MGASLLHKNKVLRDNHYSANKHSNNPIQVRWFTLSWVLAFAQAAEESQFGGEEAGGIRKDGGSMEGSLQKVCSSTWGLVGLWLSKVSSSLRYLNFGLGALLWIT